jgi:chorismate mutase/prephenate dehydratase
MTGFHGVRAGAASVHFAAMAAEEDLTSLRMAIDDIDDKLLELLNDRAQLVHRVAAHKTVSGGPFYVPTRERAIVDRLQLANAGPFPTTAIRPVFQEIISACLALEAGMRVAFLGPEGTFTHLAVKRHFGTAAPTLPCGSIPAVFAEVERGAADFGIVPVENSSEGVVTHTLDSFVESALTIQAEVAVKVEQCLLARTGTEERAIERVYSHPQGLAQCRAWLTHNLARAQLVETSSTSEAARRAAEDPAGAAIGSELAARLNGLAVLRQGVQDASFNVTRFLVLGRGDAGASAPRPGADPSTIKTTVLLVLGDRPGDLFEALRPLSAASINLTRIESRPSRKGPWEYVFFLDLEGHAADPRVAAALREMSEGRTMRVLGSYRKADET